MSDKGCTLDPENGEFPDDRRVMLELLRCLNNNFENFNRTMQELQIADSDREQFMELHAQHQLQMFQRQLTLQRRHNEKQIRLARMIAIPLVLIVFVIALPTAFNVHDLINRMEHNMSAMSNSVDTMTAYMEMMADRMASMNTNIANMSGNILTINEHMDTMTDYMSTMSDDIFFMRVDIENMSGNLGQLSVEMDTMSDNMGQLTVYVHDIQQATHSMNYGMHTMARDLNSTYQTAAPMMHLVRQATPWMFP